MMVAAGRASGELGPRIADRLGVELTDPGPEDVLRRRGLLPLPGVDPGRGPVHRAVHPGRPSASLTVNDALMELLVMVEAAIGASAHRVIAVCPWYGYSRQDKKSAPREPITARLVAKMLETAGIDRLFTMDLHAGQIRASSRSPSTT